MKVKLSDACLFVVCDECGLRSPRGDDVHVYA